MKETLAALARDGRDADSREILSPAVGRYLDPPPVGTFLSPGAPAGMLRVLAKTFRLTVPEGVRGIVAATLAAAPASVEYGQPLLADSRGGTLPGAEETDGPAAAEVDTGVPEGMLAVRSPTDGIFYRRPSPDDPAYVSEGDVIEAGKVLGLVEVMKSFNQIHWRPGPDEPARARVAKVLAGDAAEVKDGQPIFLLEPA